MLLCQECSFNARALPPLHVMYAIHISLLEAWQNVWIGARAKVQEFCRRWGDGASL